MHATVLFHLFQGSSQVCGLGLYDGCWLEVRLVRSAMDSESDQSPTASAAAREGQVASADAVARAALERYAALPVHCKPTATHEWTVLAAFVLEDRVAGTLEVRRWGLR